MRKISISALLFPILLALSVPVGSQTRPRWVSQPVNDSPASNLEPRAQERPRAARERTSEVREGGGRRWASILLSTGIAIGSGIGHSSCGPSRPAVMRMPRFMSPSLDR